MEAKHPYNKDYKGILHSRLKEDSLLLLIVFLLISIACIINGCRTSKTPEQKQYEATQKELKQLQALRIKYPCDTSTQSVIVRDTTVVFTEDTAFLPGSTPGQLDTLYITRYKTINHNVERIIKVVDQATIQAARDSLWIANNLFSNCTKEVAPVVAENTRLKQKVTDLGKWKAGVLLGGASLIVLAIVGGILKFKSKII